MIDKLQRYFLLGIAFLFPLFFLAVTQEYFITNKVFLLAFAVLLYILIASLHLFTAKKIVIHKNPVDIAIGLFLMSLLASIMVSSPNKVEALLTPSYGFIIFASCALFYFFLSYKKIGHQALAILSYSGAVAAILRIASYVNPLRDISPIVTPLGTQLELSLFLSFIALHLIVTLIVDLKKNNQFVNPKNTIHFFIFVTVLLAVALSFTTVFSRSTVVQTSKSFQEAPLAPFSTSWSAALESLKKPVSALFGVGIDNYTTAFSQAKTREYNRSLYWATTFNQSRSFFLHILTEAGFLGLSTLLLILLFTFRKLPSHQNDNDHTFVLFSYLMFFVAVFIFFPPSLAMIFLFFVTLATFPPGESYRINLKEFIVPYDIAIGVIGIVLSVIFGYFVIRLYAAEWYFKQSINALQKKNGKVVYDSQKKAIQYAPFIERYRISFSQVNLLIANSIITSKNQKLTESERQQVTQSIQQAISEAKSAVSLNPKKASNWENLGFIYRNIISVVKGADVWSLSSYQRAIDADPLNPLLRLSSGGVYYSLGSYGEAAKAFEQATALKSNWPNAYYNLAWAYHQKKDDGKAIAAMDKVLGFLEKDSPEYKKASSERDIFEKSRAENKNKKAPAPKNPPPVAPSDLSLPPRYNPASVLQPQVELPQEASPSGE